MKSLLKSVEKDGILTWILLTTIKIGHQNKKNWCFNFKDNWVINGPLFEASSKKGLMSFSKINFTLFLEKLYEKLMFIYDR